MKKSTEQNNYPFKSFEERSKNLEQDYKSDSKKPNPKVKDFEAKKCEEDKSKQR